MRKLFAEIERKKDGDDLLLGNPPAVEWTERITARMDSLNILNWISSLTKYPSKSDESPAAAEAEEELQTQDISNDSPASQQQQ